MLEYHDALYRPARPGEHAWPLMKLGRFDEARAAAEKARAMKDPGQRSLGLNALCAIERAGHDRAAARAACTAAYEHAAQIDASCRRSTPSTSSTLAVHAYNAALAARAAFAAEEAEKTALAGTRRLAFTPANPWRFLVALYVDQGRGSDAANALREMQRWRTRQPPQLRDQDRAETDVAVATVLLLAGRTEPALRLVDRAIDFPDRRGLASTDAWQARAAHVLLRGAISRADDEILDEADTVGAGGRGLLDGSGRRARGWADGEMVRGMLLDDDDRLVDTLRLFGERGITPVPVWLLGDLVHMVGPGVMAVVAAHGARAREGAAARAVLAGDRGRGPPGARPRRRGARPGRARRSPTLPQTEALLRARAAAIGARAARELGDGARASSSSWARLPARSQRRSGGSACRCRRAFAGSGPGADEVVAMLERVAALARRRARLRHRRHRPRPDRSGSACARPRATSCAACRRSRARRRRRRPAPTASVQAAEPVTPERAVEEFHRYAFAMPLGLTGADMSSLDGSTTVAEQAVRDRVDQMLGEIK